VALQADATVLVQDEIVALGNLATVRWAMVTRADVKIDGPGQATLTQAGKTLGLRVVEPAGVGLKIYPTDPPPSVNDARNEGTRLLGFEVAMTARQAQRLVVHLAPGEAPAQPPVVQPLPEW
jgi:hypothetical protein